MQDLYGWIAPDPKLPMEPGEALNKMLAARGGDQRHAQSCLNPTGAVAASGSLTSLADENGILAIIAGRPRFLDPGLGEEPPARCVLRLWREHGEALPTRIQGAFALAVVDMRRESVFLAIDRIGFQTMAFSLKNGGVVFSNRAAMSLPRRSHTLAV